MRWQSQKTHRDSEDVYWMKRLPNGGTMLVLPTEDPGIWIWKVRGPERDTNGYLREHHRGEAANVPAAKKAADLAAGGPLQGPKVPVPAIPA